MIAHGHTPITCADQFAFALQRSADTSTRVLGDAVICSNPFGIIAPDDDADARLDSINQTAPVARLRTWDSPLVVGGLCCHVEGWS